MSSAIAILNEIQNFYIKELYEAGANLAELFINHPIFEGENLSKLYELLGDIYMNLKQYHSALDFYERASKNSYNIRGNLKNNQLEGSNSKIQNEYEVNLRYKEVKAYMAMKQGDDLIIHSATSSSVPTPSSKFLHIVQQLEEIPINLRTDTINNLLGELYSKINRTKDAKDSYFCCLKSSPFNIPIIEKLSRLGIEEKEVVEVVKEAIKSFKNKEDIIPNNNNWIFDLISSVYLKNSYDHNKCLTQLNNLTNSLTSLGKNSNIESQKTTRVENNFIKNVGQSISPYVLILKIKLLSYSSYTSCNYNEAIIYYKELKKIFPNTPLCLENYAIILYYLAKEEELKNISNEMIQSAPNLPQGWAACSLYFCSKNDIRNSLSFIDKALLISPYEPIYHQIKGLIYYSVSNYERSLLSYTHSNRLQKDLESFCGMIYLHLMLGNVKNAANLTKKLIELYPRAPETYFLLSKLLESAKEGSKESISAYQKVLKLQPKFHEAAVKLAEALHSKNKINEAINVIEEVLNSSIKQSCHAQLLYVYSKCLVSLGRYTEAIEKLELCISLQLPNIDEKATMEIEKIENLLQEENQGLLYKSDY